MHKNKCCFFFFFNDPATTAIYTPSLHDALPICVVGRHFTAGLVRMMYIIRTGQIMCEDYEALNSRGSRIWQALQLDHFVAVLPMLTYRRKSSFGERSEEHTSDLQSHLNLVCRLLL